MFIITILRILTLPPVLAVMAIFFVWREVVGLLLSLQHGSRFGGLLSYYDAIHAVKNAEKHPLCGIFIIQHQGTTNFYEMARRSLLEKLMECSKTNTKAFSVLKRSMGYPYLLKIFPDIFDYVKRLDRKFESQQELIAFMEKFETKPLPKNGEALWDLHIGTHPIKWHGESHKYYPIFLRFNHVLSDAEAMMRTILGVFADKEESQIPPGTLKTKAVPTGAFGKAQNFQMLLKQLCLLCMAPSAAIEQFLQVREDSNALHGCALTGEKVYALNSEEVPRYVPLIKEIKSKVPKCSFSDVVLTAVSASVEEYFLHVRGTSEKSEKGQSEPVPRRITVAFPEAPLSTRMLQAKPSSKHLSEPICRNQLSYSIGKLFISTDSKISLVQRLQKIRETNRSQKDPMAVEIGHWTSTIFYGLLPSFISATIMKFTNITMIISNIPGPPTYNVFGGCKVQEVIAFGILREQIGVFLALSTYGGRLTMTLTIDKALAKNRGEVEAILDNIHKNLDLLAKELEIKRNHHVLLI